MFKKEIFRERCLQLDSNKELSESAGVTPGTMSKYLNPNCTNIPTADVLYNLADHYNVSVDWLLGKADNKIIDDSLAPSDSCKAIVSICESFPNAQLIKSAVIDTCYDEDLTDCHHPFEQKENEYVSISFPMWKKASTDSEKRNAFLNGNHISENASINEFLLGYSDLRSAYKKNEFLSSDEYNKIISQRIDDMKFTEEFEAKIKKRNAELNSLDAKRSHQT